MKCSAHLACDPFTFEIRTGRIGVFGKSFREETVTKTSRVFLSVLLVFSLLVSSLGGGLPHTRAASPDDGFIISEYVEGSSNNKAIELYNGTLSSIDLAGYKLCLYSNGSATASATLVLSGTLVAGDTYVIANSSAGTVLKPLADLTSATVINFNGDDAFSLDRVADSSHVDVIGQIGFRPAVPGSYWGVEPCTTLNHTLVRKLLVLAGEPNGSDVFDPAAEWDAYSIDDFSHVGSHTMMTSSSVPASPTGLAATDGHGEVSLSWTVPASPVGAPIDGYNVYRAMTSSMLMMTKVNATLVAATAYVDSGLGAGADYWYAVTAHNSNGEGAACGAVEGWTFNVPSPVTTLAAVGGDHEITLTWDPSYGDPQHLSVVKYNIWRGSTADGENTVTPINAAPTSGTGYSDGTTPNGTPYYYRVTAVNEVGQTGLMSGNEATATANATVAAPDISNLAPADLSFADNVRPQISATYSASGSTINVASVRLLVDAVDVTSQSVVTTTGVTYTPAVDLTKSVHSVQLDVANTAASPMNAQAVWTFTVGDYNTYFGGLHSHTNISDGTGTPQQAYDSAKAAGVDFMAVTDHSNWFDLDSSSVAADLNGGPSTEWAGLKATADTNNAPGTFVAIAGFEMTWSGGPGHINTFNTVGYDTRTHTAMNLTAYYAQLALHPDSISQLNHPGTTFGTFDDFGHWTAEADAVVNLVEVGNGEGVVHEAGYFPSYQYYQMALDKGWHVAPSNNQDTHKGNWMFSNDARTVILAPELTRDSLYEAIRQKRVYATEDKDLQVTYHLNGAVMGSTLDSPSTLNFHVTYGDAETTDIITKVSIIANGGVVVASTNPNTDAGTWDLTMAADSNTFYYVRIDQADTDVAVTAPVWTGDVVKVGLSKVEASQDPQIVGTPVDFTATAYNNGSVAISDATIEFFKDTMTTENKLGEVAIPSIGASGIVTAKITWTPSLAGTWTIYARLTATVDAEVKTFFASTTFTAANPDEVTQVVVDGGHYNAYTTGYYAGNMKTLTAMIKAQKMMPVITVLDHILTAADLQYAKILVLNDPQSKPVPPKNYTPAEIQVIKDFVDAGGSLILTSRADYDEKSVAATLTAHSAYQGNVVLEAIGSNLRLNDDEVIDDTSNGGQNYRLYFDDYTGSKYHLTDKVPVGETYSFYSGCSVILKAGGSDANVDWLVKGHPTTASLDSDLAGDATPVAMGSVYGLAAEVLPGGGRVVVGGTAFFSDFETASADNAYSNKQIINNVLNWALSKTVAQTRVDANTDGSPDLYGNRVTVEGRVTAQSKAVGPNTAFFDVIYVQDATGGLDVFGVSTSVIPLGALVRATGIVGQYEGDSQIHILDESHDLFIIDSTPALVSPLSMSTGASMLETNEGWLVQVQGVVTSIVTTGGDNSVYLDDGTGVAKVYVNGYVGDGTANPAMLGAWDPAIMVGDWVIASGFASQDAAGHRLRVRNTAEIVRTAFSPVSIVTVFLPGTGVDLPYTATIIAAGGTGLYDFSLASGTLPEGLTLSSSGTISGTPTVAGNYSFSVLVADGQTYHTRLFTIDVYGSYLSVTTSSPLPTGMINVPYYQVLSAIGGDGINYSWSLNSGELPPGLGFTLLTPSILSTTAALHGTPTAAGMYNFNLKVVSNGQAVFKDFSLLIQEPTALTVTSPNGGESWEPEAIHDVTWSVAGDTSALDHFSLYYTVDGGNSWEFMGFAPNADRSFSWTVPDRFSSRAKVIVYAMDITSHMLAYDASDSFFTIAPDGAGTLPAVSLIHPSAEAWTAGTTQTISWSVAGSLPGSFHHYSVYASLQGGRNGSWFNVGYSATPSLLWDIPATIGSAGAKIVVYAMDSLSHSLSDALPADFVIVPATGAYGITITAPAGGTPLHVGANTSVTWAVTGFLPPQVSSYQVFYSVDGGLSWELAGASAASPFSWTVPARLSTACSLMVVAMDGSANVLGIGISATFTISP
jgi:hypothetical protein